MPSTPQWRFGPFRLDLTNACLWRGDESIPLRPKPFAVLAYLMESSPSLPTPTVPPSALFIRGLLLTKGGHHHEGLAQMNQGLEAMQTTGAGLNRAYFLAQLAETYRRVGQPEGGLALVAEALELMKKTGERWWEAELHRLRGALLLVHKGSDDAISSDRPTVAEAEASLQRALATARQQQAKALELLTPLFAWFTEGFDTADLRQAKALLDGLS